MDKGELVPDEVTIQMLEDEVTKHPDVAGFIFDGFPRTTSQAEALDTFLTKNHMVIAATLALEVADDILIDRLLHRGKNSGRVDDQDEEKIRNRFVEYNTKTAPLIDYYTAQGKFHTINGEGSIASITKQLTTIVEQL